jgi:hypothetical protein
VPLKQVFTVRFKSAIRAAITTAAKKFTTCTPGNRYCAIRMAMALKSSCTKILSESFVLLIVGWINQTLRKPIKPDIKILIKKMKNKKIKLFAFEVLALPLH